MEVGFGFAGAKIERCVVVLLVTFEGQILCMALSASMQCLCVMPVAVKVLGGLIELSLVRKCERALFVAESLGVIRGRALFGNPCSPLPNPGKGEQWRR